MDATLDDALKRAKRVEELDQARDSKKPWHQGYAWKDCVMCPHPEGLAGPALGERVVLRMNTSFPYLNDGQRVAEYDALAPELAADVRRLAEIISHSGMRMRAATHAITEHLTKIEQLEQKIAEAREVIEAGLYGHEGMSWEDLQARARAFLTSTKHLSRMARG